MKIILIDDDINLLSSLAAVLDDAIGATCYQFSSLQGLIDNECQVLAGDIFAAILDINLGAGIPNGLDVYHWLADRNFSGFYLFLTGHAKDHPLVKEAAKLERAEVFEKPFALDKLLAVLERACFGFNILVYLCDYHEPCFVFSLGVAGFSLSSGQILDSF